MLKKRPAIRLLLPDSPLQRAEAELRGIAWVDREHQADPDNVDALTKVSAVTAVKPVVRPQAIALMQSTV